MPKEDFRFHYPLRVRWSEGDAQGIVFNGAYINYLEVALSEYFRNLGIRLYGEEVRKYFDTATVKVTLDFIAPAKVDERLELYTRVSTVGNKSMTVETEMYREGSDELVNKAEVVYVDYDAETKLARAVPDDIREMITHFEETGEVLPIKRFPNLARL